MYCCNFNWNIVPMTFNESYTYMEMLGKVVTQVATNATNIATNTAEITTLQGDMSQAQSMILSNAQALRTVEGRVDTLETQMGQVQVDIANITTELDTKLPKVVSIPDSATPTVDVECVVGDRIRIDFIVGTGFADGAHAGSGSMWIDWSGDTPVAYKTAVTSLNTDSGEALIFEVSGVSIYTNGKVSTDMMIDGVMLITTTCINTPVVPTTAVIKIEDYQILPTEE